MVTTTTTAVEYSALEADLSPEERQVYLQNLESISARMGATLYVNGTGGWPESVWNGVRGILARVRLVLSS